MKKSFKWIGLALIAVLVVGAGGGGYWYYSAKKAAAEKKAAEKRRINKAYKTSEVMTFLEKCGFQFGQRNQTEFREVGAENGIYVEFKYTDYSSGAESIEMFEFTNKKKRAEAQDKFGGSYFVSKNNILLIVNSGDKKTKKDVKEALTALGTPAEERTQRKIKKYRENIEHVVRVMDKYFESLKKKDYASAYGLFSRETTAQMSEEDYIDSKKQIMADQDVSFQIMSIKATDKIGTVKAVISGETELTYKLLKEKGKWKIKLGKEMLGAFKPTGEVSLNQPLVIPEQLTMRVTSASKAPFMSSEFGDTSKAKGIFLILTLAIRNNMNSPQTVSESSMFELIDQGNRVFRPYDSIAVLDDYINVREINPGLEETGTMAFDIPNDANGLKLKVHGFAQNSSEFGLIDLGM